MYENSAPYEEILAEHGAEFHGIQQGPRETLILFADPELRTTLAVPESDFLFPKRVAAPPRKPSCIRPRRASAKVSLLTVSGHGSTIPVDAT